MHRSVNSMYFFSLQVGFSQSGFRISDSVFFEVPKGGFFSFRFGFFVSRFPNKGFLVSESGFLGSESAWCPNQGL